MKASQRGARLGQALAGIALASGLSLFSTSAFAQKFCVFDPLGAQGDAFGVARDFQLAAKGWGVNIELKPYTNEGVAVDDLKAGQCDMAFMTGLRTRSFNQFAGTIDAVGGIETYVQMRKLLELLATPKVEKFMTNGLFEVVGVLPLGAGYPFVNDRSINTLAKAAGKKIAVMDWDKTQTILVQELGAQPVMSDITNYAGKFNNGAVDIIVAPIILYKPFELYKGLGSKGGIARFPVIQLTGQFVARKDKFPADFGARSREYMARQVDHAFAVIRQQEREVDTKHWMTVPVTDRSKYTDYMRSARISLTKQGFYDKRMISILKRIRCTTDPSDPECTSNEE